MHKLVIVTLVAVLASIAPKIALGQINVPEMPTNPLDRSVTDADIRDRLARIDIELMHRHPSANTKFAFLGLRHAYSKLSLGKSSRVSLVYYYYPRLLTDTTLRMVINENRVALLRWQPSQRILTEAYMELLSIHRYLVEHRRWTNPAVVDAGL